MIRWPRSRPVLTATALAVFLTLLLASVAFADGERRLELDSPSGLPEAGKPITLVINYLEGDHGVEGAEVRIVGGMGGSHDEHSLGGGEVGAIPFEYPATPSAEPGVYTVDLVFSTPGTWTVWLTGEKGGKLTEASFEVPVSEPAVQAEDTAPAAPADPALPSAGAASTGSESPAGEAPESAGAPQGTPTLDEHAGMSEEEMAGHGGLEFAGKGDSHEDSETGAHGASGDVNWFVIGSFLAVIAGATIAAALLKRHLREQIASGSLASAGVSGE